MSIKWTDWHLCPVTKRQSIISLRVSSFKFRFLAGLQVLSKSKTFDTSNVVWYLGRGGLDWKAALSLSMGVHPLYKTIRQIDCCRQGRSSSVYCWVATPTVIQVCQEFKNLGYSWMNGTFISCCCKVCPLIQLHSVLFGSPSSPWFHDDIASSCWNVLLSESSPDKRQAISWSLGHNGWILLLLCGSCSRDTSLGRSTGWLINIWQIFGNQTWVLHSGAMTKARAWSSCSFWRILDNMLKGEKIYTYLFSSSNTLRLLRMHQGLHAMTQRVWTDNYVVRQINLSQVSPISLSIRWRHLALAATQSYLETSGWTCLQLCFEFQECEWQLARCSFSYTTAKCLVPPSYKV